MYLRYITCSDPRDHNNIDDIIKLTQMSPLVEIAVQAHPSKVSRGTPRYRWIDSLLFESAQMNKPLNLALHVNCEWAQMLCFGHIPCDLQEWFSVSHPNTKGPLINRVQINMPQTDDDDFSPAMLARLINQFQDKEFIIQYNANTRTLASRLHETGANFSVLFDSSGGQGVSPLVWPKPSFYGHNVGYAGGLGRENIRDSLENICAWSCEERSRLNKTWTVDSPIWVDAEGKLKNRDKFDTRLARDYITNALAWQKMR